MREKAVSYLWNFWTVVRWYGKTLADQFLDNDCQTRAAALTYTTLFAVVPLMTVAYTTFSIMPAYETVQERIESFIFSTLVPESSAALRETLLQFAERARGLTVVGFVFLFVTSFMLLVTIEQTLNAIWQVPEPRRGFQRILLYWATLSLGPPTIVVAILISAYLASQQLLTDLDVFGLGTLMLSYLPMLLTWFGFTVLYFAMPNCQVRIFHAAIGGFLTMLSFELAKIVFNYGISRTSLTSIYGTFAAVPFLLIWMYMVWVLVLCGAIVVRTLSLRPEITTSESEPALVKAARVLDRVYAGHLEGHGVSEEEIHTTVPLTTAEHERIFLALKHLRLLTRDEEELWVLGRSLKTLTLWDLYQALPEGLDAQRLAAVRGMDNVVEPLKSLLVFGSNQMSVSLDTVLGGSQ